VAVILDCVGAAYLQNNLDYLNVGGRLFIIGSMTGFLIAPNITVMIAKKLSIQGQVTFSKRRNGLLKKAYDGCL
ncbi:hypothetical protein Gogos_020468, partial [Gossypium gossypioides]|nr:hypothetical protein [Gossypium gossypioides]